MHPFIQFVEYLPCARHCSTFDRAFSAPFPLSAGQEVGTSQSFGGGECDLRQQVLDASLSCFGHLGVSGGTSASQCGDLGNFDASLWFIPFFCSGHSFYPLSPLPLLYCFKIHSSKLWSSIVFLSYNLPQ